MKIFSNSLITREMHFTTLSLLAKVKIPDNTWFIVFILLGISYCLRYGGSRHSCAICRSIDTTTLKNILTKSSKFEDVQTLQHIFSTYKYNWPLSNKCLELCRFTYTWIFFKKYIGNFFWRFATIYKNSETKYVT